MGIIVNPIAGLGGKLGLKGTDGNATLQRARQLGAQPLASARACRSIARIAALSEALDIFTGPHELGEDVAASCRLDAFVVGCATRGNTCAGDTAALAAEMLARQVDLIMFAGGDGTARDIHDVVGNRIPLIGIPTGVKMHSAVFAMSPESAGNVAAAYLGGRHSGLRLRDAEIMDIDEDQLRDDRVSTKLYGFARVPHERALVQSAKARAMTDDDSLMAACAGIVEEMEEDRLYFIGPGTTTRRITERLGLDGSLLGVDAVMNRRLIGRDLNERQLLELLVGNTTIIVTVIGGQGFIFGRGNQQVSADVLRRVGRDNIVVVAGLDKLLTLDPCYLRVDTNDTEVDAALRGFMPVHTGPGQRVMMRVET